MIPKIKLGLLLPPAEHAIQQKDDFKTIKEEVLGKKTVTLCSQNQTKNFEIIDVEVMAEASIAVADDSISFECNEDNEVVNVCLNESKLNSKRIQICLDLGGGTSDMVFVRGLDIIAGSEHTEDIGVENTLALIAEAIQKKYNTKKISTKEIGDIVRYETEICSKCGAEKGYCDCDAGFTKKKYIFNDGNKTRDVEDIVKSIFDNITDELTERVINYKDAMFSKLQGLSENQLSKIYIIGGGAELYGDTLIDKLKKAFGDKVLVEKAKYAPIKNILGLVKYSVLNNRDCDADYLVMVDLGNANTKAVITDTNGNLLTKAIEIPTQIAKPIARSSMGKFIKPDLLNDLEVKISGDINLSAGDFYIGKLADEGLSKKYRSNAASPKSQDKIFYIMTNAVVATLLHKIEQE